MYICLWGGWPAVVHLIIINGSPSVIVVPQFLRERTIRTRSFAQKYTCYWWNWFNKPRFAFLMVDLSRHTSWCDLLPHLSIAAPSPPPALHTYNSVYSARSDSRFDIGLAKGVLHLLWLLDSVFVVLSEDKSVSLRTWPAYKHCLLGNTTAPSSTTTTHCSFLPPSPVVVVVVGRKKFHSPIRCILLTGFTLLYSLSAAPAFIPMILSFCT